MNTAELFREREEKIQLGKYRCMWETNIKMYLQYNVEVWMIHMTQNRDQWQDLEDTLIKI
jgi:hypothetical protein